mmetsp:Transcript_117656/g.226949  ORF Transcript_117656/g.226949 Transcript_117656/m.226949 type:complete len:544 (-) Transcript_117656:186-1817(-)
MGSSQSGLRQAVQRAAKALGHSAVAGRYHTPPAKLEDDYEVLSQELGTGFNGVVHLATNKQTGEKCAVKAYSLLTLDGGRMEELELEAQIYLGLDHPHVARLMDVYQSRSHLYLVMEACTGGELYYRVEKRKKFSEGDAAEAFHQMLLAVHYLHTNDIVHRDLKLENFLYEEENSDHLKLIDFGFSDIINTSTTLAAAKGTLAYMAPEVLQRSYTSKCDIWSLGVILFILLVGYMPFGGLEAKQRKDIKDGKYKWNAQKWQNISKQAQDLVKSLLIVDPKERPSAQELLSNQWVLTTRQSANEYIDPSVVVALQQMSHHSRFRRTCLSMMAWSLNQQERATVRNYFLIIDKDNNGSLSLEEFRQVLLKSKTSLDDATIEQIFEGIDTSGDHKIDYTEFLAAMVDARLECHDNLIMSAFQRFDADNSGQITYDNLKKVLGEGFSDREVKTIIYHADADHDGQISYDEFYAYLKKSPHHNNRLVDGVHATRKKTGNFKLFSSGAKTRSISVRDVSDGDIEVEETEDEDEESGMSWLLCQKMPCRN